ncbi:copper amine oxidase N-terminal domain-containing protein [Paenibacillus sp. N3/727]|uniref:copper amine oxidase N-terminal domain-containing protein n=1 Tax=Paenibacillus sp. N3/727 TaxID=2925845 RepID=UPI001F53CFAC|nr:copper amine oxidase N-terminal domain-containing protein [Paenibacillus sp. N3/727]UNK17367.1 copper amine oxidase N-terminal domain-containing protein [Paenibacillus sp. N3/727]
MKKLLGSFIAAALISSVIHISDSSSAVSAASSAVLSLRTDEQIVELDTDPVIKNGNPFLPVYMLREWSGMKLKWDQKSRSITVWSDGERYVMKNGSRTVVNGEKKITLDTAVYIVHGRAMIPASLLEQITGAEVEWDKDLQAIMVKSNGKRPIAVADNRPDVKLFGMDEKDGVFEGLVLEAAGKRHKYNWETPLSWKDVPQMTVEDLNKDGKSEVVVILNQGSGTGLHVQEIHVVNPVNFKEIPVESLEDTIKKRVSTQLKKDGDMLHVTVDIKGSQNNVNMHIPDFDYVDQTEMGFGAVMYYAVENNKLVLRTGGNVSFSAFIGDLEITYGFNNGQYVAEKVQFIPFEEYKQYIQEQ